MSTFAFGPIRICTSQIFFASRLSYGIVNLKPLVPGHVLVVSKRNVPRLAELTGDEVADLFQSAQKIARVIEQVYEGEASTLAMQDGPAAGQTVPHCHVHIIPRSRGDWPNNDDVYRDLDKQKTEHIIEDLSRPPRSPEDMAAEATKLRAFFPIIVIVNMHVITE
ncbi:bis-triphosphatase-like protein [Syncephalis plumigaleata]|nr:bis-triphosphatase-like protein [Syncephalis plumigaleata]